MESLLLEDVPDDQETIHAAEGHVGPADAEGADRLVLELVVNYVIGNILLVDCISVCLFNATTVACDQFLVVGSAIDAEVIITERNELDLLVNGSAITTIPSITEFSCCLFGITCNLAIGSSKVSTFNQWRILSSMYIW